jgi:hypothetical protein
MCAECYGEINLQCTGKQGAAVPDDAEACKHFEPSESPPLRYAK